MLKANQPSGFHAGMGTSVRRTCALIWVLPLLQTNHSFVRHLPPHRRALPACPAGKFMSCLPATQIHQHNGLTKVHGCSKRQGARSRCTARCSAAHVSQACRAPRWHLLATTWVSACTFLTLATKGYPPFSLEVRIKK